MKSLLILCVLATAASAAEVDTSGLTDKQVAELALQAEQMKSNIPGDLQDAEEWVDWGTGIGKAISATAAELGVAVDDFSRTGVGKITIGVIVYKVIGKEVVRFFSGIFLFFMVIIIWAKYLRRPFEELEYHENGKLKSRKWKKPVSDGEWATFWIMNWGSLVVGIALSFVVALA